jgi:hypothetical protein
MRFNYIYVFILSISLVFLLTNSPAGFQAAAHPRGQAQCPTVRTTCPDTVAVGEKLTFTVNVSGGDTNVTPTYNWTVSAGTISSGQGTSLIEVETSGLTGDSSITATVDVGGFDRSCSTASSCTTSVMKKTEARKVDEYGALKAADENPRLDNFAIELQNDPTAQGYIIAYNGRKSRPKDAQKAAGRAKAYMTKKRGLDANRVVTVEGGYREQPAAELWVVPSGASIPDATPTVSPDELKPAKPAKTKAKKSGKKS